MVSAEIKMMLMDEPLEYASSINGDTSHNSATNSEDNQALGSKNNPLTNAHLGSTPEKPKGSQQNPISVSPATGSGRGRQASPESPTPQPRQSAVLSTRARERKVLAALLRVDTTHSCLDKMVSAALSAILVADDEVLATDDADDDAHKRFLSSEGVKAALSVLSQLDPAASYATIVKRGALYLHDNSTPPQLAHAAPAHTCGLCGLLLSHPVLLRSSTAQATPALPQLSAHIEHEYPGFWDFTCVKPSYDIETSRSTQKDVHPESVPSVTLSSHLYKAKADCPLPQLQFYTRLSAPRFLVDPGESPTLRPLRPSQQSLARHRANAKYREKNLDDLQEKARQRMARCRAQIQSDCRRAEAARERAREASRLYRQRHAQELSAKDRARRERRFLLKHGEPAYLAWVIERNERARQWRERDE
ncbi:hypothetical protein C8F01DRAFT_1083347 [Mycena amicta]|nr:hypothetical protein C8F01DRAFT_1083347 [Mycena amicta]